MAWVKVMLLLRMRIGIVSFLATRAVVHLLPHKLLVRFLSFVLIEQIIKLHRLGIHPSYIAISQSCDAKASKL